MRRIIGTGLLLTVMVAISNAAAADKKTPSAEPARPVPVVDKGRLKRAGVLLYCSFENGVTPDYFAGRDPVAGTEAYNRRAKEAEGRRGKGIAGRVVYRAAGNLDAERGTIAFHLQFTRNMLREQYLFSVYAKERAFYNWMIQIIQRGNWLRPWVLDLGGLSVGREADITRLDTTRWHHYALAWDRLRGSRFYLDGKQMTEDWGPDRGSARLLTPHSIRLSVALALDELYVFDRALETEEVAAVIRGRLPVSKPVRLGVTRDILDQLGFAEKGAQVLGGLSGPMNVRQVRVERAKSGTITMTSVHDGRRLLPWPDAYCEQRKVDIYPEARPVNYITLDGYLNQVRLTEYDAANAVRRNLVTTAPGCRRWLGLRVPRKPRAHLELYMADHLTGEERKRTLHEIRLFDVTTGPLPDLPKGSRVFHLGASPRIEELGGTRLDLLETVPRRLRKVVLLADKAAQGGAVSVGPLGEVQLISAPMPTHFWATGLRLDLALEDAPEADWLEVSVREPTDALRELVRIPLALPAKRNGKRVHVRLGLRGFIVAEGERLWVTLGSVRGGLRIGPDSTIVLEAGDPETVRKEAVEDLMQVAQKVFSWCAEGRPWGRDYKTDFLTGSYGGYATPELDLLLTKVLRFEPDHAEAYATWAEIHRKPLVRKRTELEPPKGVPAWAFYQREVLKSQLRIAHWWVDHRMMADGQLGGNWNDDPCLTCYFSLAPLLGDAKGLHLVQRVADGWAKNSGHNTDGYNNVMTDYLHSSDETAGRCNLLTFDYGNPKNILRSMACCRNLPVWIPKNPKGGRSLAASHMASGKLVRLREPDFVGGYIFNVFSDPVAWAWYSGDPRVTKMMLEMADTWLKAGEAFWKTEKGKRELNLAVAIDGKTGEWRPGSKSGQQGREQFFFTAYILSGDRKYLKPIERRQINPTLLAREMPVKQWPPRLAGFGAGADPLLDRAAKGRASVRYADLPSRMLVLAYLRTGKKRYLAEGCRLALEELLAGQEYLNSRAEKPTDRVISVVGGQLLSEMYCGGPMPNDRCALVGSVRATWDNIGTDIGAVVSRHSPTELRISVYNFLDKPKSVGLRVWRLNRGAYTLTVGPDADDDDKPENIVTTREILEIRRGTRVELRLQPGLQVVHLVQTKSLPRLGRLPDLAVSPDGLGYDDKTDCMRAYVHNVGSADAESVEITLYADGRVLRKKVVSRIPWYRDWHAKPATIDYAQGATLRAKTLRVECRLLKGDEITLENNVAEVPVR